MLSDIELGSWKREMGSKTINLSNDEVSALKRETIDRVKSLLVGLCNKKPVTFWNVL